MDSKQSKLGNKRITKSCKLCNKQVLYFDTLLIKVDNIT